MQNIGNLVNKMSKIESTNIYVIVKTNGPKTSLDGNGCISYKRAPTDVLFEISSYLHIRLTGHQTFPDMATLSKTSNQCFK